MSNDAETAVSGLEVRDLVAGYGKAEVLHGLSLQVKAGEAVGLFGPNGAGKSTLVKTIVGVIRRTSGEVRYRGRDLAGLPPFKIHDRGIGLVSEGLNLFPNLSVYENLYLGSLSLGSHRARKTSALELCERFPVLGRRRDSLACQLSGGERKLLAIGRAVLSRPSMLIVDEPSLGLSPAMVRATYEALHELHAEGLTLLIVEQDVKLALEICTSGFAMEGGRIRVSGSSDRLQQADVLRSAYLRGPAVESTPRPDAGDRAELQVGGPDDGEESA